MSSNFALPKRPNRKELIEAAGLDGNSGAFEVEAARRYDQPIDPREMISTEDGRHAPARITRPFPPPRA